MKILTWQNPEQLFVVQVLINKVKSKCCGIKVVNKSKMENIEVPLPPLEEQHRIVAKIEEIFAQLDAIEASL